MRWMSWKRHSWETRRQWLRRLTLRTARAPLRLLARLNPVPVLQGWSAARWGHEDYEPTALTSFADWCLWKLAVAEAILRCFVCWGQGFGADDFSPWVVAPLRLKAVVCLLLGWHWQGSESEPHWLPDSETILSWNWRKVGYYEQEWEDDRLDVALGWRDWRVTLHVQGLL